MTDRVTDRGTLDKYMININFAERNSEAAMGNVGSGGHYVYFLGCRVAHYGWGVAQ
jgi:hypothetical protein